MGSPPCCQPFLQYFTGPRCLDFDFFRLLLRLSSYSTCAARIPASNFAWNFAIWSAPSMILAASPRSSAQSAAARGFGSCFACSTGTTSLSSASPERIAYVARVQHGDGYGPARTKHAATNAAAVPASKSDDVQV
jgi:hypothetical protein